VFRIIILVALLLGSFPMKASQIRVRNQAEQAVMRYAADPLLWLKDVCDFTPRPTQMVNIREILEHSKILDLAPPRFGKTVEVEMAGLYETATTPFEDYRIWAPKYDQAINSLRYQTDAIESSQILSAWIATKKGKRQLSTTSYEFWNRSNAKSFGMSSNFEGENATILRGEEFDDMDLDIWRHRILHRGAGANRNGKPTRIRVTGTIQAGRGNIFQIYEDPSYHNLADLDVYVGLELGYYSPEYIADIKQSLSRDEWERIYLLQFTEAKNFILKPDIMASQQQALRIGWQGVEYLPGEQYRPQGQVFAGLDMGHSGEKKGSSHYSAQFIEQIGETIMWLGGKRWKPTADTNQVKREFVDLWEFYGAGEGYGDALKPDLIADINDMLYERHLIRTDRQQFPENSQSNWNHWDFAPRWNTGLNKWDWASNLRNKFEAGKILLPYFDRQETHPHAMAVHHLIQNLLNVRIEKTGARYPSLGYIKKEIGDDDFDSLAMAAGCAHDRAVAQIDLSDIATTGRRQIQTPRRSIATELQANLHSELSIERF